MADDTNDVMLLGERIKRAYDQVELGEDAQERMLAELLAAQRAQDAAGQAGHGAADQDGAGSMGKMTEGRRSRRRATARHDAPDGADGTKVIPFKPQRRAWRVALPLAAVVLAGLVVLRMSLRGGYGSRATEVEANVMATAGEAGAFDGYAAEESGAYLGYDEAYEEVVSNTEEYDALEETGFVSARTRQLSTVSADVDTASYCNLRRMLRDGYRIADWEDADDEDPYAYYDSYAIPAGAVRIEEMLNYFRYGYATPAAGSSDLFATTVSVGACPWNADTVLVSLGFATAPEATSVAEAGCNLVFLIDVSGSMDSADKLGLLKRAFGELVSHLGASDRVSVVTYASGEEVVLEGASGDDERTIMRAINSLHADGMTNGQAGLAMAYEVAGRNYIEGGVNRIVMASDGDLNVGMSSESELHDYVDRQRQTGIYLSVLGFGSGNYKDNKMETLADHGNGSYHYIDCVEEAERVLGEELTANLVPLADDVKVQVEFNPALVKGYRLVGYENRALADEDFRNDERDAGDVGPGAQFTVVYEVALVGSAQEVVEPELRYGDAAAGDAAAGNAATDEWLAATIRYQPADGSGTREQQVVVGEGDLAADPGEDWCFQAAVIELGMLLRGSDYSGSSCLEQIATLVGYENELPADRAEFLDLASLALE